FSALDIQDDLQTLYTSGTVFHAFLGEKLPDWKAAANLVRKIAENYKLPYYTMSPTYSICRDHGYLTGEQTVCPICGQKTEVYSRITGYYRPIQNWNDGKAQEYRDRRVYNIGRSTLTHTGPNPGPGTVREETTSSKAQTIVKTGGEKLLLFKTPTCPNCKAAIAMLNKAGASYELIDAEEAQNRELVDTFGIRQAPTLIVEKENGFEKLRGVSEIAGWVKKAANQ
nr:ribonucleoside triphosphate reductase [Lachnospiraceae bacterium]